MYFNDTGVRCDDSRIAYLSATLGVEGRLVKKDLYVTIIKFDYRQNSGFVNASRISDELRHIELFNNFSIGLARC
jgi:hypothetical protein